MTTWWFQRHIAQRACLVLGGFLTIVFVMFGTLLPLLMRGTSIWTEVPLRFVLVSPTVLLPVLSLVVLAGAFVRSRWVLPVVALVLTVLLINWHRQFGSADTVAISVSLIAGAGILAWSGWSRPHLANVAEADHSAASSVKLLSIAIVGVAAVGLFVLVGFTDVVTS